MIVIIQKSKIYGKIKAPSSKSYTHRALVLAALTKGKSQIVFPLSSDDTEATIDVLRKIGIKIKKKKKNWEVQGGKFLAPKRDLFCRESGTTLRFMTAVSALIKGKCRLSGEKSLLKRPIEPLVNALRQLGANVSFQDEFSYVVVKNNFLGGKARLPGNISSQFVSALLLIAPLSQKEVEIELTTPLESKPYVLMTIEAQKRFGVKVNYSKDLRGFQIKKQKYKPRSFFVEGDWSSVAPFLVAGVTAGKVEVENLDTKSLQADKEILNILKKMRAKIKIKKNSVIVKKSELKPIKINLKDCPDLFPIICVLAAVSKGRSEISGIKRLRIKESDRIEEMRKGLSKMGIKTYLKENRFFIEGNTPGGGVINSTDHRIAMAFSILGLTAKGKTIIKNAECVSKSFPHFFDVLKSLRRKRNIVLIGYRGTGKTAVAKILTKRLKMPLIAMDEIIVKRMGMSIPKIVKRYSWKRFRDEESKIVKKISNLENCIIDSGGGVVLRKENIKNLKNNSIVFWLKANTKTIINRIKDDTQNQRPSLTGNKSFVEEVAEVLRERKLKYKTAADYIIDVSKLPVAKVANKVIKYLKQNNLYE